MSVAVELTLAVLGTALLLGLVRIVRGPHLADRVVAFDLLGLVGIAFCATAAIATDSPVLLDVALVLAVLTVVGTLAFARYIEAREP